MKLSRALKRTINYSIEVPAGTTTVPDIKAISSDEDIEITIIDELEAIPGVKVIQSANNATGAVVTYRVGVGYAPAIPTLLMVRRQHLQGLVIY